MFWVGWFIWFNEKENDTLHHILNRLLGRTPFSIQSKDIRNLACKVFDFSCYGICSPSISMNLLNKFWRVRETFLKWKSSQNICYLQSFEQPHVRWHLCRALKQLQSVCLLHGPKWWQVRVLKKKDCNLKAIIMKLLILTLTIQMRQYSHLDIFTLENVYYNTIFKKLTTELFFGRFFPRRRSILKYFFIWIYGFVFAINVDLV